MNANWDSVIIGNGEAMDTGDPDGDGVMGEDWYNGYDDDGDGLIDEDYFIADGIDNAGVPCISDTNGDGCVCCTGDFGVDEEIDLSPDSKTDGVDNDGNGIIDDESSWDLLRVDDRLSIKGIGDLGPNSKITVEGKHSDGSTDSFVCSHSMDDLQVGWFRAGSALNYLRAKS